MPYQSEEILDRVKEEPKKTLDPHEDDKLSGDMRELYDRLQPKPEHVEIRDRFLKKMQRILETEFPGVDMKVHVFGSSGNMLWTAESDGKAAKFPYISLCVFKQLMLNSGYLHPDAHEKAGRDASAGRGSR